jgi:hypothetical protein
MASNREWLVYTTAVGGLLHFGNPEDYEEALKTGKLDATPNNVDRNHPDFVPTIVEPRYMAILKATKDYDFALKRERGRNGW